MTMVLHIARLTVLGQPNVSSETSFVQSLLQHKQDRQSRNHDCGRKAVDLRIVDVSQKSDDQATKELDA